MARLSPYDDPAILNRFLEVIRGKTHFAETATKFENPGSKLNPESRGFSPMPNAADGQVENDLSETSNGSHGFQPSHQQEPAAGILAPRHSPFPQASVTQKTAPVDLVQDQNGFVTELTIAPDAQDKQIIMQKHPNIAAATHKPLFLTPTQHRLLVGKKPGIEHLTEDKLAELSKQTLGYMDNVVDRFRKSKEQILARRSVASGPVALDEDQESNLDASDAATLHGIDGSPIKIRVSQNQKDESGKSFDQQEGWQEKSPDRSCRRNLFVDSAYKTGDQQTRSNDLKQVNESPEVVPFPTFTETPTVQCVGDAKVESSTTTALVEEKPLSTSIPDFHGDSTIKEEDSGEEGVLLNSKTNESSTPFSHTQSPTIVVTASTETDDSAKEDDDEEEEEEEEEEEDRENLALFKSWGTPAVRNKPKSRPRTVILTGLPRGADFTLVQSLIHGGAIECMRLISSDPARFTVSAHVTFTSADACDRYYEENPNGMEVRYQGRKWSVLVHKKDHVDVISGMLQGYLECGATRVVKVSGADDDWGIVALNKLAEGRSGTRQVEAVQDTYHNGIRTIVFRFANISHAVQFKGILIRSGDWEGCHVDFAEDPCEKATGVRND